MSEGIFGFSRILLKVLIIKEEFSTFQLMEIIVFYVITFSGNPAPYSRIRILLKDLKT
jgi:hypothetical protein